MKNSEFSGLKMCWRMGEHSDITNWQRHWEPYKVLPLFCCPGPRGAGGAGVPGQRVSSLEAPQYTYLLYCLRQETRKWTWELACWSREPNRKSTAGETGRKCNTWCRPWLIVKIKLLLHISFLTGGWGETFGKRGRGENGEGRQNSKIDVITMLSIMFCGPEGVIYFVSTS